MTTEPLVFDRSASPTVFEKTVKEGEEPLEADVKQEKLIEGRVVMRNPQRKSLFSGNYQVWIGEGGILGKSVGMTKKEAEGVAQTVRSTGTQNVSVKKVERNPYGEEAFGPKRYPGRIMLRTQVRLKGRAHFLFQIPGALATAPKGTPGFVSGYDGPERVFVAIDQSPRLNGTVSVLDKNVEPIAKNPHSPSSMVESTPRTAMNDGTEAAHGKVTVNTSAGRGDTSRNPTVKTSQIKLRKEFKGNWTWWGPGGAIGRAEEQKNGTIRVYQARSGVPGDERMIGGVSRPQAIKGFVAGKLSSSKNPVMPWGTRTGKKHPGEGAGYSGRTLGENASAGMGDTSRNPDNEWKSLGYWGGFGIQLEHGYVLHWFPKSSSYQPGKALLFLGGASALPAKKMPTQEAALSWAKRYIAGVKRNPHALIRSTKARPGSSAGYSGVKPTRQTSYKAKDSGTFGQQHILEGEVPIEPGLRNPKMSKGEETILSIGDNIYSVKPRGKRSEVVVRYKGRIVWRDNFTTREQAIGFALQRAELQAGAGRREIQAAVKRLSGATSRSATGAIKFTQRNPHSEDMAKGTCPYCGVSNLVSSHETVLNCGGCGQSLKVGGR